MTCMHCEEIAYCAYCWFYLVVSERAVCVCAVKTRQVGLNHFNETDSWLR